MHSPFVTFIKAGSPDLPETIRTDRIERITVEMIEQMADQSDTDTDTTPVLVPVTAIHLIGKGRPALVQETPTQAMHKWRASLIGPLSSDN